MRIIFYCMIEEQERNGMSKNNDGNICKIEVPNDINKKYKILD